MRILVILLATLLAVSACHREGPAEKAGKQLDQAAKDVKDAVKGDNK